MLVCRQSYSRWSYDRPLAAFLFCLPSCYALTVPFIPRDAVSLLLTMQRRAARKQVRPSSFNKLLLRFGHLNKGFAKCKTLFHSLDKDGNEAIDPQELADGCNQLGFDIGSDVIDKVFSATDLDGNKVIDFREFIVVLAVLHMISTEVGPQCCGNE